MLHMDTFTLRAPSTLSKYFSFGLGQLVLGVLSLFLLVLSPRATWAATEPTGQANRAVVVSYTAGASTGSVVLSVSGGTSGIAAAVNYLVVVRAAGTAAVAPMDNTTYAPNLLYGTGNITGTGNYVVKADASTANFTVTGLALNTTYYVEVYAYNTGTPTPTPNYLITNVNTASFFTTPNAYVFLGTSNDYAAAANWSPNRTTIADTDILIFDGSIGVTFPNPLIIDFGNGANSTIQIISQLRFIKGANVTVSGPATAGKPSLLSISGSAAASTGSDDFFVDATSSLTVVTASGNTNNRFLNLKVGATKKGLVQGAINFNSVNLDAIRLLAGSTTGLVFSSTSTFTATSLSGSPFGNTSANTLPNTFTDVTVAGSVVFQSGAMFIQKSGNDPFGTGTSTTQTPVAVFNSGSTYTYSGVTAASTSVQTFSTIGQTYGNLQFLTQPVAGTTTSTVSGTKNLVILNDLTVGSQTSAGLTISLDVVGSAPALAPAAGAGTTIGGNVLVNAGNTPIAGSLSFTPTAASAVIFNGTAAQEVKGTGNVSFGASTTLTNSNATVVGLIFSNPNTYITGNIVGSSNTLTFNPAPGIVYFNGGATQTVSGTGTLTFGKQTTLNVTNVGARAVNISTTTVNIGGDIVDTPVGGGLAFTSTVPSIVSFNGNAPQSIGGPSPATTLSFNANTSVVINNTSTAGVGSGVTLNRPVTVNKAITFTSGLLTTTTTNVLSLPTTATVTVTSGNTNVNNTSFVNGPVVRTSAATVGPVALDVTAGTGLFFPIGNALVTTGTPAVTTGGYRPITLNLNQTAATATAYTGQVLLGPPPTQAFPTSTINSIKRVSKQRYYTVSSDNGLTVANGQITIYYGTDDRVDGPSNLRIAKSQTTNVWANLGGGSGAAVTGPGAPIVTGSITSNLTQVPDAAPDAPFTSLGNFVLATTVLNTLAGYGNNPLPVELTALTATAVSGGIQVDWATASEKNSAAFEVQRSADGQTFHTIAAVRALGRSSVAHSYNNLDRTPLAGLAYYRLRQVDADGTVAYSQAVTATWSGPASLQVYPNPSTGTLYVRGIAGQVSYRVLGAQGQVLLSGTTSTEAALDVQRLAAGMYLLELMPPGGRVVQRFVRQ